MSIDINNINFELDLEFYVYKEKVTKMKVKEDGEIVFITREWVSDKSGDYIMRRHGEWTDIEHSIDEVSLRTRPKSE